MNKSIGYYVGIIGLVFAIILGMIATIMLPGVTQAGAFAIGAAWCTVAAFFGWLFSMDW